METEVLTEQTSPTVEEAQNEDSQFSFIDVKTLSEEMAAEGRR